MLQWLNEHCLDADRYFADAMIETTRSGQLAVVQWFCENMLPNAISADMEIDAMYSVIEAGNLAMVKLLHELQSHDFERRRVHVMSPIDNAAPRDSVELVKRL